MGIELDRDQGKVFGEQEEDPMTNDRPGALTLPPGLELQGPLPEGHDERARILSGQPPAPSDSPAPAHPDPRRWEGILRSYGKADVERLRGSIRIEHTLARLGAERLWELMRSEPYVNALGALTGGQAVQMVRAGLKAIYLSGWQVAGDANSNGEMYPDQSLYSVDSVPKVVKKINATFKRADEIQWSEGKNDIDYFAPIVADAESGFGGVLNAYELMRSMIEAGAAGVHFEDQLSSEKKCGHLGGKVLIPTAAHIRNLNAARLAADVMGTPTILLARTDAEAADLDRDGDLDLVVDLVVDRQHRRLEVDVPVGQDRHDLLAGFGDELLILPQAIQPIRWPIGAGQFKGLETELLVPIHIVARAVAKHLIPGRAAEEAVDRLLQDFTLQIPQGQVNCADGIGCQPGRAVGFGHAEHHVGGALDGKGILPE